MGQTVVTATNTRRKQQQEMLHKALEAKENSLRTAREAFLLSDVNVLGTAAYEPALHNAAEQEHDEGNTTCSVFTYHCQFPMQLT